MIETKAKIAERVINIFFLDILYNKYDIKIYD